MTENRGTMGKDSEGTNKTEGEIALLPNFRRDNSDFRVQANTTYTLSRMYCPGLHITLQIYKLKISLVEYVF